MKLTAALALAACLVVPSFGSPQDAKPPIMGPAKGALVIVGGGSTGKEIWDKIVELAGGVDKANFVVIPTAGMRVPDDGKVPSSSTPRVLDRMGIKHVTILHTSDRKVADSDDFVAPLKTATAVWFDGGRQWHLADSYIGTKTEKELFALLDRGGVIAGSSAGATIIGSYLTRGDTSGPEMVEGDHVVGMGFLKSCAIDQHIIARNREFDLVPFIKKNPNLLGIGINESTAIVVQGDQFEVIGASHVAITDANQWKPGGDTSPNHAASKGGIYFLSHGQKFDLAHRRILPGTGGRRAEGQ